MSKMKRLKIVIIICIIVSILIASFSKTYAIFYFNNAMTQETSTSTETHTSFISSLISALKRIKQLQNYFTSSDENEEELENFKTANDKDGDGLLDNTAQYVNNQMVAPIDPDSSVANAPIGIWQKQIEIEKQGNIPYYLTDFYVYDDSSNNLDKKNPINWGSLRQSRNIYNSSLNSNELLEFASNVLNFRLDNGGVVLHSQTQEEIYNYMMAEAQENLSPFEYMSFQAAVKYLNIEDKTETWQKKYGYNDLYDKVFRIATKNNMRSTKLYFQDNNEEYVLWVWRGDYLTLGSGAEMGLYKKRANTSYNIEHWDAVDFEVPMTLNLYNYYSANNIEHVFSWKPENNQWWITGFNPNYSDIDVEKQVLLGTVDFSEHQNMYTSLKENINQDNQNYVIFDDANYKVWISFYE